MAFVEKGELKMGLWLGLGLAIAFTIWGFLTGLFGRARGAVGG